MSTALVKYDAACRAIADAVSLDEVKEIRNQAEAARAYAKQAGNRQLELDAAEIRLRAERRLGEILVEIKRTNASAAGRPYAADPDARSKRPPVSQPRPQRIKVDELGIEPTLRQTAIRLARPAPEDFDLAIARWRNNPISNGRPRSSHDFAATLRRPKSSGPHKNRSPYWFKLLDQTPLGRVKIGKLRARIAACHAEARLLQKISDHVGAADALASIEDCITTLALEKMIAGSAAAGLAE